MQLANKRIKVSNYFYIQNIFYQFWQNVADSERQHQLL